MASTMVVKVKRVILEACLKCVLCEKLFQDATTISECLHTFCRKCVYDKLTDEELECCPICNIDLGCAPIEKLRPDHNLQDVRAKIFPLRSRKVSAPEITPSISLPVRRKERSLSSLVVNTPRVSTQSGLTGRRTKPVARKAASLRGSNFALDESIKKEENAEDLQESSSSLENLCNTPHRRQNTYHAESSNHLCKKDAENGMEMFPEREELWKPLNCLVEAANRTKSLNYNPQGFATKSEQSKGPDTEASVYKTKRKEHPLKFKPHEEKNNIIKPGKRAKAKRLLGGTCKRAAADARDLYNSAQELIDAPNIRRERGTGPIWLSLIASAIQEGGAALTQISPCYLRIKNGNLPVSFIQKYLARKLGLTSESEVDITCRGQPVLPTLELHKLADLWLQTGSSQKAQARLGSSAKDLVMIVNYARKLPAS